MSQSKLVHALGLLIAAAILTACGGGDNLQAKYRLEAKAEGWENRMPTAVFPGEPIPCTALIVAFSVSAGQGQLPRDFAVNQVVLRKGTNIVWQSAPSTTESGLASETIYSGVARGCSVETILEGETVEVVLKASTWQSADDIKTSFKLYYAS